MNINACPEPDRLQALLAGALTEVEQAALTTHVEGCGSCQEKLETLAGGSWADRAKQLGAVPPADSLLKEVVQDALNQTTQGASQGGAGDVQAFLSPSQNPASLGRLLHYEILAIVGKGGFGTVFKAFDEKLRRVTAIKVLAPELAASGTARRRFSREAQAVAVVKNDHVIAIHAVHEEHTPPFLVMEFIEGMSLQDKLDKSGALEVKEILRIGMQSAEGLAAAHKQGKIHRDIKPANILLENGVQRVKITDFGLARTIDDASITQSGVITGTPMYMAPEQAAGESIDHRADLFSLGSVLYTMCTGRPPFRASGTMAVLKRVIEDMPTPIREINPEIPEWLCAIIAKLQAKKPVDRFETAKVVAELLGQHLAHEQQPALTVRPATIPVPPQNSPVVANATMAHVGLAQTWWLHLVAGLLTLIGIGLFCVTYRPNWQQWLFHGNTISPRTGMQLGALAVFLGVALWFYRRAIAKLTWSQRLRGALPIIFIPAACFLPVFIVLMVFYWLNSPTRPGHVDVPVAQRSIAGTWESELGQVTLEHDPVTAADAVAVSGVCWRDGDKEPLISLITKGTYDPTKGHLKLNYSQRWNAVAGSADLQLSDEGDKLEGSWANTAGESGIWTLNRKKSPAAPDKIVDKVDGWTQLFNGRSYDGWKVIGSQPGHWLNAGPLMVATGGPRPLFTYDRTYGDFHFRMEANLNKDGEAGLYFRMKSPAEKATPALDGYAVKLTTRSDAQPKVGSLFQGLKEATHNGNDVSVKPGEWFVVEVIAQQNHLIVKLDGRTTADNFDPENKYAAGYFGLRLLASHTTLQVRKIEVKELSPSPQPPTAELRRLVTLQEQQVDLAKQRLTAQTVPADEVTMAEIELFAAKIRLAEAEKRPGEVAKLAQSLLQRYEDRVAYVKERFIAGSVTELAVNQVEQALSEARIKYGIAAPPFVADPVLEETAEGVVNQSGTTLTPLLDDYEVRYPIPYKSPPNLTISPEKVLTHTVVAQLPTGFKVRVSGVLTDLPSGEFAKLNWRASGISIASKAKPVSQTGTVDTIRIGDFQVFYPVPYAQPPHLQIVFSKGRGTYAFQEQNAQGFKIHVSGQTNDPTPILHWRAIGLTQLGAKEPAPLKKAAGRVLRFDPAKDITIANDGITVEQGTWKIVPPSNAAYWSRLFELRDEAVENCQVTLRGQIKTATNMGFPNVRAHFHLGVDPPVLTQLQPKPVKFTYGISSPEVAGNTGWAPYSVTAKFLGRPNVIAVNLATDGKYGAVWLKDLELAIDPLPEAERVPAEKLDPPIPAAAKSVRRFAPPKDGFITLDYVTATKTGWKIVYPSYHYQTFRMFELLNHGVGPGTIVFKMRVKTEMPANYYINHAYPTIEIRSPGANKKGPATISAIKAQHNTNWAWYEARVNCVEAPEVIALGFAFDGVGTAYLEDVELLHIPAAAGKN